MKFENDLAKPNWPASSTTDSIDEAWTNWKNVFLAIVDKNAPPRMIKIQNKPSPWINSDIKRAMDKRDYFKKKAMKSNSIEDWSL